MPAGPTREQRRCSWTILMSSASSRSRSTNGVSWEGRLSRRSPAAVRDTRIPVTATQVCAAGSAVIGFRGGGHAVDGKLRHLRGHPGMYPFAGPDQRDRYLTSHLISRVCVADAGEGEEVLGFRS